MASGSDHEKEETCDTSTKQNRQWFHDHVLEPDVRSLDCLRDKSLRCALVNSFFRRHPWQMYANSHH